MLFRDAYINNQTIKSREMFTILKSKNEFGLVRGKEDGEQHPGRGKRITGWQMKLTGFEEFKGSPLATGRTRTQSPM